MTIQHTVAKNTIIVLAEKEKKKTTENSFQLYLSS